MLLDARPREQQVAMSAERCWICEEPAVEQEPGIMACLACGWTWIKGWRQKARTDA